MAGGVKPGGARADTRLVTRLLLTLALALALAPAAAAQTIVGVNEDAPKWSTDRGAAFFGQVKQIGMAEAVVSLRYDPAAPTVIESEDRLAAAIRTAESAKLKVVLAVYPGKARAIADGGLDGWLAWLGRVTTAFPTVATYIVGNEPNQPRFWQPQFDAGGRNASGPAFGAFLAASYDLLHEANDKMTVVGIGLSPRGNDNPHAKSNVSTSPVRFLQALGAWYRQSGRKAPLMDGLSFHPYPPRNDNPPTTGYGWPNIGLPNLDLLKQTIEDSFGGTPQLTVSQGLQIHLDEIGWQVDTEGKPGYTGTENVPTVDEETQAAYDGATIVTAVCDANVASLHFFHFLDESDRDRFQTGSIRVDGTPRPSFDAIRKAIADTGSGSRCPRQGVLWQPTPGVLGASLAFTPGRVGFVVTATENATFVGGVYRVADATPLGVDGQSQIVRQLTGRKVLGVTPVERVRDRIRANFRRAAIFRLRALRPGFYVVAVAVRSDQNAARQTSYVSLPFEVRR